MKRLVWLFLTVVVTLLSSCGINNSAHYERKNYNKNDITKNNLSDAPTEDYDFYDEGENLTEYEIERTYEFRDGYALIEFADDSGYEEYFGIINSDGKITYAFNYDNDIYYEHHSDGRFYFTRYYNDSFDIFCVNNNGELIYNLNFSDTENFRSGSPAFYEDGSFVISKTNNNFYDGSFVQVAKFDSSGKCVCDWSDVELDGSKALSISTGEFVNEYATALVEFSQPVGWKELLIKVDDKFSIIADLSSQEFNFMGNGRTFAYENVVSVLGNMIEADSEEDYLLFNPADNSIYNLKSGTLAANVSVPDDCESFNLLVFTNGYAPLCMSKQTNGIFNYYLTLIDADGRFMFEPKPINGYEYYCWDGTNLLVVEDRYLSFLFYDVHGELQCEVESESTVIKNTIGGFSEGYVYGATDNYGDGCCYIKYDGTVLFPEGTVSVDRNKITQSF